MPDPTPIIKGSPTTIRWGTGDVLQGALSTAIVKSVRPRKRHEELIIEGNTGFEHILVGLMHGDDVEITVVDDTAKTWPDYLATLSLKVPSEAAAKNFFCLDNNVSVERKREGERVMSARYFVNIAAV
jgi:CO dehydrogenase nickel-insertion accessory protein CooC1